MPLSEGMVKPYNNTMAGAFPIPSEYSTPKTKESDAYGLAYAKAAYFSSNRYGYRIFNETQNYNSLFELAQGRQSVNPIYRMLGFHGDRGLTQQDNGALAFIDVQVLNLVTKYINKAVAKLQKYQYNVSFSVADPISVDEAREKDAKIKTLFQLRDWFKMLKIDPQQYFPEIDFSVLPEYPEELMLDLSVNSKIKKVIDAEKTMKLVNGTLNNMSQVMREFDWYMCTIGRGHLHCYLDENSMPRIKCVNPKYWGGSYCQNEDFSDQEYSFYIDFISRNQFKKEAEGLLTKEQINTVLSNHAYPNTAASFGTLPQYYDNYDGLEYIPVMRFYFLSNDNVAYKIWNHNSTGNRLMDMTHYNYFPTENSKKEQKVVQNSFTSIYGGSWVVDSEIVYDYGRKEMPRTQLVNTRLPIVTFAPNMKEGRYVSMVAQMEEPAYMLNVAWNRLKDILAKGRMGTLKLNLTAIDQIALGKGGNKWTEKEAIDFLFQSNIIVTRENTNQYGQSNGNAAEFMNSGLTIADYMTTITACIRFMDELAGSSVVETANVPDRMTTDTMKSSVIAAEESIEYLINGHKQAYKQACHILMLLTQQAKMDKVHIQGMIPALGASTMEFFEVPDSLPYCEYGLQIEPAPSQEEWISFYMELQEAMKEGRINASDSAFIRQVKEMTAARQILANREKINESKAAKLRQEQMQFQSQVAADADQRKLQVEMAVLEKKKQDEIELMQIQARIDDALMQREKTLDAEIANISGVMKERIAKQQGIDAVLRESIRARSEDNKSQSHKETAFAKIAQEADRTFVDAHVKMTTHKKDKQTK